MATVASSEIYLPTLPLIYLTTHLLPHLTICLSTYPSSLQYLSIYVPVCPLIYLHKLYSLTSQKAVSLAVNLVSSRKRTVTYLALKELSQQRLQTVCWEFCSSRTNCQGRERERKCKAYRQSSAHARRRVSVGYLCAYEQ